MYNSHLLAQWFDRQVYWTARSFSIQTARSMVLQELNALRDSRSIAPSSVPFRSVLTFIVDGRDQAKYRILRFQWQLNHAIEKFPRLTMHL